MIKSFLWHLETNCVLKTIYFCFKLTSSSLSQTYPFTRPLCGHNNRQGTLVKPSPKYNRTLPFQQTNRVTIKTTSLEVAKEQNLFFNINITQINLELNTLFDFQSVSPRYMSILRQLNLDGKQLNDMFYNLKLSLQKCGQ